MQTRQATARDMLNTIKQRCFMLSDLCHVEKDNAACLFSAKCIRMFAPTGRRNPFTRIAAFLFPFFPYNHATLYASSKRVSPATIKVTSFIVAVKKINYNMT